MITDSLAQLITDHLATYPANLCPLLFGGEFAKYSSDFGEPIDQPVEGAPRAIDWGKRAPEHFEDMLSGLDSLKDAGQIGLDWGGHRGFGRRQEMAGLGANGAKLALQVVLSELGVEHGHFR
jgi:hypothetical protein